MPADLALNAPISPKVQVVERALWSRSGEKLVFNDQDTGSWPSPDGPGSAVISQSIDNTVRDVPAERVDFVKMDIEGAESTIRRLRPRLAIALCHVFAAEGRTEGGSRAHTAPVSRAANSGIAVAPKTLRSDLPARSI
jgi:FkbM family methyltransferase